MGFKALYTSEHTHEFNDVFARVSGEGGQYAVVASHHCSDHDDDKYAHSLE